MSAGSRIARVSGRVLVLPGDEIDTDRIIPARFLKAITFDGLEDHVFEDDRREDAARGTPHPFDRPEAQGARILLVGSNFGCGSSREHAPRAIAQWGIRAIAGGSFAEIFFANAVAIGLPCVTIDAADRARLVEALGRAPDLEATVDLEALALAAGDQTIPIAMPATGREAMLTGHWDATGLLLERYDEVAAVRARLPYLTGF